VDGSTLQSFKVDVLKQELTAGASMKKPSDLHSVKRTNTYFVLQGAESAQFLLSKDISQTYVVKDAREIETSIVDNVVLIQA
jgi:hypothetical protein